VVRGENGHAVSSYTDPPSSAQFERLAQDVLKLRYAAEETNGLLKRLPQEYSLIKARERDKNLWDFFFPAYIFGIVHLGLLLLLLITTASRT
jgi:hypothetical protein